MSIDRPGCIEGKRRSRCVCMTVPTPGILRQAALLDRVFSGSIAQKPRTVGVLLADNATAGKEPLVVLVVGGRAQSL